MPVHLTAKQLAALNIAAAQMTAHPADPPSHRVRRRPTPYLTECRDCHEQFSTRAAETRHLDATHHARFQLVIVFDVTPAAYAQPMTPEDPDVPDPDAPATPDDE